MNWMTGRALSTRPYLNQTESRGAQATGQRDVQLHPQRVAVHDPFGVGADDTPPQRHRDRPP